MLKTSRNRLLLIFCISFFTAISIINVGFASPTIEYPVGEFVEYEIKVKLDGQTGDYYYYTEKETETRLYTIQSSSATEIDWKLDRSWVLTSNEGDYESDDRSYYFSTHPTTFAYLDGSIDGPDILRDYYTYDNLWIRIDPSVSVDDEVHILGSDYRVVSKIAEVRYKGKYVTAIQLDSKSSGNVVIENFDYDPDGTLTYTFEETYYFDPTTGYLIKSNWHANAQTSVGAFNWDETIELTDASFTIPISPFGIRNLVIIYGTIAAIVIIVGILYRSSLRADVARTVAFLRNDLGAMKPPKGFRARVKHAFSSYPYPMYSHNKVLEFAPNTWNPLEMDYHTLLEGMDAPVKYRLKAGVFIVIDPQDRLGIVDISRNRLFSPKLVPSTKKNIEILFQLALTTLTSRESDEYTEFEEDMVEPEIGNIDIVDKLAQDVILLCQTQKDWKRYAKAYGYGFKWKAFQRQVRSMEFYEVVYPWNHPKQRSQTRPKRKKKYPISRFTQKDSGFALSDDFLLNNDPTYSGRNSEVYKEVELLLSRRKVIDYSLGQAPLTAQSHLRKLEYILAHTPKKVLLVGDDDLISISLARRGIEVHTLEIDPYTCALVDGIARNEGLNVSMYQVDLRKSLPQQIPKDFDLFVADPDFTLLAFGLFLSRGLSCLRDGGIGMINFEGGLFNRYQIFNLLKYFNINLLHYRREKWTYTSIHNHTRRILDSAYRSGYGKYSTVHYRYHYVHEIVYDKAPYKSQMYVIQKSSQTEVPLEKSEDLTAPQEYIYDL